MRRSLASALLWGLCLGFAAGASAQDRPSSASDDAAKSLLQVALGNIGRAKCGADFCTPATPEELASPPVSADEARLVMVRAVISSNAETCGLDWQQSNFAPMMAYWREDRKKTDRQLALIAMLHGLVQSSMGSRGSCTDEMKRETQARSAFKP